MTKPYARLDRELILDAGMVVAARAGTTDVSFRMLGEHLGSDPTAIYRHFRNKDELVAGLVDRVVQVVAERLTGSPFGDWRQYLYDGAVTFQDVFLEFPSIGVHVAGTRRLGPAELRLLDLTLQSFHQAGLREDELVKHYGAYAGVLLSFTAMACHARLGLDRVVGDDKWMSASAEVTADDHPQLFTLWDRFVALDYRQSYLVAMDLVLAAAADAAIADIAP